MPLIPLLLLLIVLEKQAVAAAAVEMVHGEGIETKTTFTQLQAQVTRHTLLETE
jgi:hypothetical protein